MKLIFEAMIENFKLWHIEFLVLFSITKMYYYNKLLQKWLIAITYFYYNYIHVWPFIIIVCTYYGFYRYITILIMQNQ